MISTLACILSVALISGTPTTAWTTTEATKTTTTEVTTPTATEVTTPTTTEVTTPTTKKVTETTTATPEPPTAGIFYPYGRGYGDKMAPVSDDGSTSRVAIGSFPFYGCSYSNVYVNTNGALTFEDILRDYTSAPFTYRTKMIAPYWSDVDTTKNNGRVYYRSTRDPSILNRASQDVASKCLSPFRARSVFIATWDRVTFCGGNATTPTNTFQSVLITDGTRSFVIFNYRPITWTTGKCSGGSAEKGRRGTHALVGFNSDSSHHFSLAESRTPDIVKIGVSTNCNILGRHMFRVDQSTIRLNSCSNGSKTIVTPKPEPKPKPTPEPTLKPKE